MSVVLPVLYHWSPSSNRSRIRRRGLKATCPTAVPIGPPIDGGAAGPRVVDPDASVHAVCLGTSPSHAWSLSADVFGRRGEEWDCWQVSLDVADEVHPLPFFGTRLQEVRVNGPIAPGQLWLVGTRQR